MESSPFSESEKLQLFAEIIAASKASTSSAPSASDILLRHILNENLLNPDWNNTVIPSGRTVGQCQQALREGRLLLGSRHGYSSHYSTSLAESRFYQPSLPPGGFPLPGLPDTPGRQLAPRPPDVPQSYERHGSSYPSAQFVDTTQRKRGRPTKVEAEKRRAAEARGESVPRPRPKKARPSLVEPGISRPPGPSSAASGPPSRSPAVTEITKSEPSPITTTTSATSATFPQTTGGYQPTYGGPAVSDIGPGTPLSETHSYGPPDRNRRSDTQAAGQLPSFSTLPSTSSYPQEAPQRTTTTPQSFPPASRPPGQNISLSSVLSPPDPPPYSAPGTREPERR